MHSLGDVVSRYQQMMPLKLFMLLVRLLISAAVASGMLLVPATIMVPVARSGSAV